MRWARVSTTAAPGADPGPRSSHSACAIGGDFYVYGGELEPRKPVDACLFRLRDGTWTKARGPARAAQGGPLRRCAHECCRTLHRPPIAARACTTHMYHTYTHFLLLCICVYARWRALATALGPASQQEWPR